MPRKRNTVDWYIYEGLDKTWIFIESAMEEDKWFEVMTKDEGSGEDREVQGEESTNELLVASYSALYWPSKQSHMMLSRFGF